MSIEKHRKELDRIANVEDYPDDDDAIDDGARLLEIALVFDHEIKRLNKLIAEYVKLLADPPALRDFIEQQMEIERAHSGQGDD